MSVRLEPGQSNEGLLARRGSPEGCGCEYAPRGRERPTKWDRDSFVSAMEDAPRSGQVADAYRFFVNAAEEWAHAAAEDGGDIVPYFAALQVVIRSLLKIVVIDLEANDNAQAIFEVQNTRGTELLAVDLIRTWPSGCWW